MPLAHGPDTSHYQTILNEALLPNWELWSHKLTEGRSFRDPTAPAFLGVMARKKVRYRGVYAWLRPDQEVISQVLNLRAAVNAIGGFEAVNMIQVDWERTAGTTAGDNGCATYEQADLFWRSLQAAWPGRIIMYSAPWVPGFRRWRQANPDAPLWYADYSANSITNATRYNAAVLQWTSKYTHPSMRTSTTSPGFDMNQILRRDVLEKVCGYGGSTVETAPEPPPVVIQPAPTKPPVVVLPNLETDEMFILDSDTHGSCVVRPSFRADGSAGFQCYGIPDPERRAILGNSMSAVKLDDANYDHWTSLGDPK